MRTIIETCVNPGGIQTKGPKMMTQSGWSKTEVHEHSGYFCFKCGTQLKSPAAVYRHLRAKHG